MRAVDAKDWANPFTFPRSLGESVAFATIWNVVMNPLTLAIAVRPIMVATATQFVHEGKYARYPIHGVIKRTSPRATQAIWASKISPNILTRC